MEPTFRHQLSAVVPAKAGNPGPREVRGYWAARFHPQSALADFGTYWMHEIGNIRFRER
jgi:hypothetical protein